MRRDCVWGYVGGLSPPRRTDMAKRCGLGLALLLAAGAAGAAGAVHPEMEAEQPGIEYPGGIMALGGSAEQQLAQAFELTRAGYVSHVMVPMSCQPKADVRVTIEKTTAGA